MVAKAIIPSAFAAALLAISSIARAEPAIPPAETRAIAEEAVVYGLPMIMNYGVLYEYNVDKTSTQYKGPFNQIFSQAQVFTPADTAVITPNSDTPYGLATMDLRAEPMVLCVPEVEKGRYYSVQLVDMYTFNYGYVGSRATGNGAGCYLVAGPDWQGPTPQGVKQAFRSETQFSLAIYRTQLFNAADVNNVRKVQAGYTAQTLSQFLKQPAPPPAAPINFPKIDKELAKADPFAYLNFILQFAPPVPQELALRKKFAAIGIGAGKPFDTSKWSQEQKAALVEGAKSGVAKIEKASVTLGTEANGWRTGLNGGDRQFYAGDWLKRAAVALAGIYANDAAEALYPAARNDMTGAKLNGGELDSGRLGRYTITFPAGQLPPVNAFWSVTMYNAKTQLLVANPIKRYLVNSPMLLDLKKNADGSLTLYVQEESPGDDKESNWLPAPKEAFYLVMRLYWPQQAAYDGAWKPPAIQPVK